MKPIYLRNVIALFFTITLFFSCSDDETLNDNGLLNISAKGTYTNLTTQRTSSSSKGMNSEIVINNFMMNISEFELELDLEDDDYEDDQNDQWDDDGYFDSQDEIELMGPFELDLMSGQISFLNVEVPMGVYEELEFEFDVSTDPTSDLFGKSVLIEGTIDGTPFIFWHYFEEEVEVDFEDTQFDIAISQASEGIVIDFDLGMILDSTNGVDLSIANDGNMDGTIEISPEDPDGNTELAGAIKQKIKEYINLLED
ncbi:hypothetical protein MWU58_05250 [Flavobacteriaceae bacterium S0825]|uniref:hypothetical protein n=1 Tax=Gaetbulibacter sp. S0825 TaxID=2720084 RepID=UPI0014306685|nr:hypothetical protein [Gaetbulibacter sp. S0825]MCK0108688.1 hypothetical protein [Flavobacteriaceae bacterium S0825]NIX64324.1 hypothetical protein [Gaetbulibacter sp. S0825]